MLSGTGDLVSVNWESAELVLLAVVWEDRGIIDRFLNTVSLQRMEREVNY